MIDVRCNNKHIDEIRNSPCCIDNTEISFTLDNNVDTPIIMIHHDGTFKEIIRDIPNVKNYLKYGYNRIIKKCPLLKKNCIGEKCSWYFIEGVTGDCAMIWNLFKGK